MVIPVWARLVPLRPREEAVAVARAVVAGARRRMTMRSFCLAIVTLAGMVTYLSAAPQPASGARTFATPEEAAHALVDAAAKNDGAAMLKIFGPEGKDIVETGDPAEQKESRAEFARR